MAEVIFWITCILSIVLQIGIRYKNYSSAVDHEQKTSAAMRVTKSMFGRQPKAQQEAISSAIEKAISDAIPTVQNELKQCRIFQPQVYHRGGYYEISPGFKNAKSFSAYKTPRGAKIHSSPSCPHIHSSHNLYPIYWFPEHNRLCRSCWPYNIVARMKYELREQTEDYEIIARCRKILNEKIEEAKHTAIEKNPIRSLNEIRQEYLSENPIPDAKKIPVEWANIASVFACACLLFWGVSDRNQKIEDNHHTSSPPSSVSSSSVSIVPDDERNPLTGEYEDLYLADGIRPTQELTGELSHTSYWTEGGKSYHFSANCTSLKRSRNVFEGTLQDALNAGKRDPCNICAGGA